MRLFYALMPAEATIAAVAPLMAGVSGARWQTAAQLHVTLRFIGEVSGRMADDLALALPGGMESFPLFGLEGVGYFETKGWPNALWVGVTPRDALTRLHQKLDRACQMLGLAAEHRRYMPHTTLARLSRSAGSIDDWIGEHAGFAFSPAAFTRCSLVSSHATTEGSNYEELASVRLR